jgi:hypothetical protein
MVIRSPCCPSRINQTARPEILPLTQTITHAKKIAPAPFVLRSAMGLVNGFGRRYDERG